MESTTGTFRILPSFTATFFSKFLFQLNVFSVLCISVGCNKTWSSSLQHWLLFPSHPHCWPFSLLGSCFLGCLELSVALHGRKAAVGFINSASPELWRSFGFEKTCWFVCELCLTDIGKWACHPGRGAGSLLTFEGLRGRRKLRNGSQVVLGLRLKHWVFWDSWQLSMLKEYRDEGISQEASRP